MKSQSGLTDEFFAFPLVAVIMIILALVAIPNFMNARDRAKRKECIQTIGNIRKAMEMYTVDGEPKYHYPFELNNESFSQEPSTKFIIALGKYTDITKGTRNCSRILFNVVTSQNYTITAIAKDRRHTPLTTTSDDTVR